MNHQLSLFDNERDSDRELVSLAKSDSDINGDLPMPNQVRRASSIKMQALKRFLAGDREHQACINVYSPGRRNTQYFRLSYRQGRKMKHVHIPGGSTISELARYRVKKLQQLIDRGAEIEELTAAIRMYRSGGNK